MNHMHLLIRNQCGSHIIHGMPNPLAFQQNYSRYDGPSESGIFSSLDEPVLMSYLRVLCCLHLGSVRIFGIIHDIYTRIKAPLRLL